MIRDIKEINKRIGGGQIESYRFEKVPGKCLGIVVNKNGGKCILTIELEQKKTLFGKRIVGAHFAVGEYW